MLSEEGFVRVLVGGCAEQHGRRKLQQLKPGQFEFLPQEMECGGTPGGGGGRHHHHPP